MRPGVPAAVAICAVFVTGGSVRAQEDTADPEQSQLRKVAVIDLSEDDDVKTLDLSIYAVINGTDGLRNPDNRSFDSLLTGRLADDDQGIIKPARESLTKAEALLGVPSPKEAELKIRSAQETLAVVTPTAEVQALYADLALVRGLALLDEGRSNDANVSLALVHRLDPARQLDPVKYPPNVTSAYKRAADTVPAKVTLEVKGNGRVWIDFIERGPAPGTFSEIETGDHIVTITGPDRDTRGVVLTVDKPAAIAIEDAPASDETRVKRARLELSRAQAAHDDVGRANAMHKLAALLGVGDVVMISKRPDGKLQWETWKDRAPGFSAPKLVTKQQHDHPEQLLEGIAPPKKVEPPKPSKGNGIATTIKPIGMIDIEKPWYELRWVQASMIGTAAAIIVGGILWARRDKMWDPGDGNISVKQGSM